MLDKRAIPVGLVTIGAALLAASCSKPPAVAAPAPAPGPVAPAPTTSQTPVAADVAASDDAVTVESTVRKVTVYSDRARLTRAGSAKISTEPAVFAFRNLPGWVDDGSVRVATSAGRILDVRVDRSFLARPTDDNYVRAEKHHRMLTDKLAALTDEIAVLDAQKKQIENIKAFSIEKITQDSMLGNVKVESYADVLKFISQSLRETAKARRRVESKRVDIQPEFTRSIKALGEMKSLMKLEETTVLVTLQGTAPGTSTVSVTYLMPGATWEPMHELRVSTKNPNQVEVLSYAVVTQTTGEDWGDAEMAFSTQSSVQAVRVPELEQLTLGDTKTATRRFTRQQSSFTRAESAFRSQNALWNKVHRKSGEAAHFDRVYQSHMKSLEIVQGKTVRIFEQLRRRGTTAHYKANAAPSIRGDGHPVRLRLGNSKLKSHQRLVAAPEQSLNVARTMAMTNTSPQSLLPGKVSLYQDGAFLGMTDVDFIAKGESFSLFVSVADHIKLSRVLDKKRSGLVRKRRNRMQVAFVVKVENLSDSDTLVNLADRIPVSENRDIRIDNVRIAPSVRPDSRGILKWEVALEPREVREFRISYRVEYPSELVLETKRKRKIDRSRPRHRRPAPAASPDYKIEDQLVDLEELL